MEAISRLFDSLRPRPLTEAERASEQARRDEVIDRLARTIVARRLEAPAALFLELHRPLGFLASQTAHFARPFLAAFLSPADLEAAAEALGDPRSFDRLMDRLHELSEREPS